MMKLQPPDIITAYLQFVDRQADGGYFLPAGVGQNFHRAPEEPEAPDPGGAAPPLPLLLSGRFQGGLHHQLRQALPGSGQI